MATEKNTPTTPQAPAQKRKMRLLTVLAAMGPGLIAALSGTDAGGIATYSNAGALFGFGQLWTVPIMGFLMIGWSEFPTSPENTIFFDTPSSLIQISIEEEPRRCPISLNLTSIPSHSSILWL